MIAAAEAEAAGEPPPERPSATPVVMMTSPLFHGSGLSGATLINLVAGGKLVFRTGRFDAMLQTIAEVASPQGFVIVL